MSPSPSHQPTARQDARDPRAFGERLRRVFIVAKGEVRRAGTSFNPKTLVAIGALAALMGIISPFIGSVGLDFDHDLYQSAVDPDSPVLPAALRAPVFRVVPLGPDMDPRGMVESGRSDIAVRGLSVFAPATDKGRAALAALEQAVKDHTFRLMAQEENEAAAFPVRVELVYVEQDQPARSARGFPDSNALRNRAQDPSTQPGDGDGTQATQGGGGGGDGSGSGDLPDSFDEGTTDTGFAFLPPERSINTPETLSPPFPFRSLVLAYLFLLPMNFVVQIYAGSIIQERLGRRGEALLASPASPWEIVLGKTLPYFVLMLGIGILIAWWIGAGLLTVVAVLPLILVFLALEFVAAMFARSFRELTFLTVFASVLLTMYAFLPAAFTEVHPIALISPISLVVLDLRDSTFTAAEFLYSVVPLSLVAFVLFLLGRSLFTEEDLFHQKPVMSKVVDAVARQIRGVRSGFRLSWLFIPFVFVAELMLVAFLFAWPFGVGIVGVLLVVALVEELFKGIPSYAAFSRDLVSPKRVLAFGAMVGFGFFLAEKAFFVASAAGLYDVQAGTAVFGPGGEALFEGGIGILVALGLLAMPMLLHMSTAMISALGAQRGRAQFLAAFALAVSLHLAYNVAVLRFMRGVGL